MMPFAAARVPWRLSASETGDIDSSPRDSAMDERSESAGQLQSFIAPSTEIDASVWPSPENAMA
jgi:hypothetical protein